MTTSTQPDEETTPWAQLCDIVRYAPIGALLDAPTLLPELAERGKAHVRNAEFIGKLAVREAEARFRPQVESLAPRAVELLRMLGIVPTETETDGEPAPPGDAAAAAKRRQRPASSETAPADVAVEVEEVVPATEPSGPTADDLAIPDYDSLSASQVVNRLPGLSADELEAVRRYEAAHRGRKTILNKVAQLQASA